LLRPTRSLSPECPIHRARENGFAAGRFPSLSTSRRGFVVAGHRRAVGCLGRSDRRALRGFEATCGRSAARLSGSVKMTARQAGAEPLTGIRTRGRHSASLSPQRLTNSQLLPGSASAVRRRHGSESADARLARRCDAWTSFSEHIVPRHPRPRRVDRPGGGDLAPAFALKSGAARFPVFTIAIPSRRVLINRQRSTDRPDWGADPTIDPGLMSSQDGWFGNPRLSSLLAESFPCGNS
jgi:hypothetical protein